MRTAVVWSEKLEDREGGPFSVYDVAFSPDGVQLLVAAGPRVYVYNAKDGTLIQALKGHKETVLCVAYSKDGKRFATAGSDKNVIIWTSKLEGILRYSHNDIVRCLAYNPVTQQLASCTPSDFGLWSPEQKAVTKHKVTGQANACCWTSDGYHLAIGLASGSVSIRNRTGEEKLKIDRPAGLTQPIWGISCVYSKEHETDVIAVVDWSQNLSFYDVTGKQIGKDRSLGFDPLCVQHSENGEFIFIAGSNKQSVLYTKDGILVGVIGEYSSWVWTCKANPEGNHIAIGTQDGEISVYELVISTVHSLYKERYAYRENMTDVIIQHLISEEKVRIKCRDLIKKIAIYKDRLAIQLPERVVIYEVAKDDHQLDMHYKVKEKINQKMDCTLLVVCAENIVLCLERRLQSLTFQGTLDREWFLDSAIRYIRVIGGPSGREGLLVGLKSGQIVQIYINNPFPINIVKVPNAIRCLDLSVFRKKLAAVDDKGNCYVYDLNTKKLIYQEANANSVAWNSQFEDMLCFSGAGTLSIKASNFETHSQQLQGFVVGFCGVNVFCLHYNVVTTVEVSQSVTMFQYMQHKLYKEAFQTACLGVTENDWNQLAHGALEGLELYIALKAFRKTRNYLYLDFINSYNHSGVQTKATELSFLGDVMAYKGQFIEAAKLFKQAGHDDKAVTMYTDLRMFDQAQELVQSGDSNFKKELAVKRADWVHNINEPRAAAEMYLSAGDYTKAIEIIGQHAWIDMLMNVVRQLDKGDRNNLSLCADFLVKHKQYFNAAEVYQKMGDYKKLALILAQACQWEEAFKLVNEYPDLKEEVYVAYANWLAENDRFVDAQQGLKRLSLTRPNFGFSIAFHKAGKTSEALAVLHQLTSNAVNERRFNDVSYYFWILSMQFLDQAKDASSDSMRDKMIIKYTELQHKADIYYAYHNIYRYIEEPFTSFFPDALFNMARFLFHATLKLTPEGVSKVCILYALAKQGRNLGAYKLARLVYERLQTLHIPTRFQDAIEMGDLTIRAKPFSDAEDLLPLCYRCSTTNPLYNERGNQCVNCQQPFVFSFGTFDVLPLVEFEIEEDISDKEAMELLRQEDLSFSGLPKRRNSTSAPKWEEEQNNDFQTLKLDDDNENNDYYFDDEIHMGRRGSVVNDLFTAKMSQEDIEFKPVVVNRKILQQIKESEVIVLDWPEPLRKQFYRNLMPDVNIKKCSVCNKFFHGDEFEMQILQFGHCSFCRSELQLLNR